MPSLQDETSPQYNSHQQIATNIAVIPWGQQPIRYQFSAPQVPLDPSLRVWLVVMGEWKRPTKGRLPIAQILWRQRLWKLRLPCHLCLLSKVIPCPRVFSSNPTDGHCQTDCWSHFTPSPFSFSLLPPLTFYPYYKRRRWNRLYM